RGAAGGADRSRVTNGGVVCATRGERGTESGAVSGGDSAAHSVGREGDGGGVHRAVARGGDRPPQYWASVCGSGCAGDADDADAGAVDCRVEGRSGRVASRRTPAVA